MTNFTSAFVTGATGLLGNNLVHSLAARGVRVTALVRSLDKARKQLRDVPNLTVVAGDMLDVAGFAARLQNHDVLFHTAAHFRDSYRGGDHHTRLMTINVDGTRNLMAAAWKAGISRMVHTSSIAVLDGEPGSLIDETCLRSAARADDYYLSKIRAEHEVLNFLEEHHDFRAVLVLPGWMHGPGDLGPTSAGQIVRDFVRGKLPGIPPATFSIVDARDVAEAQIAAAQRGRSGERYLAAGRNMTMAELFAILQELSSVEAPKVRLPLAFLYVMAAAEELYARLTGRPVLLSLASVRLLAREGGRTRFDHRKSEQELGLSFRPVAETLRDEITWFRAAGILPSTGKPEPALVTVKGAG